MSVPLFRPLRLLMVSLAGFCVVALVACSDGSKPTAADGDEDRDLTRKDDVIDGRGGSGTDSNSPPGDVGTIAPGEPHADVTLATVQDLVTHLGNLGADVDASGGSLEPSFFFPAAHLVRVNGQEVRVHAYDSVEALKKDAGKISPDGGMLDGTPVRWMEAPYFFARGTLLVLYVGTDATVVDVLYAALGTPFAGHGAIDPEDGVSPPNPAIHDRFHDPALIVVGTEEELAALLQVIDDDPTAVRLRDVDLSQNFVVAVFRGQMPTAGYGVEIEHISLNADGGVTVEVSLVGPAADDLVATVITYPVDVAVVPRADVADPALVEWLAYTDQGRLLARFADGSTSPGDAVSTPSDGGGAIDPKPEPLPVDSGNGDGSGPDAEPVFEADILGRITQVEVYEGGDDNRLLARILIEADASDLPAYDKAWVEIVDDTALSFDGETFAPPTLKDLEPGRTVAALFTGDVRESYPVQAVARAVVIMR